MLPTALRCIRHDHALGILEESHPHAVLHEVKCDDDLLSVLAMHVLLFLFTA